MHRIRSLTGAVAISALLLIAGCTDIPTAPTDTAVEPSYGLIGDLLDTTDELLDDLVGQEVSVLERSTPLAQDEVVTETIGYWGGTIRLPEAGLTVTVPWGALRERTEITVTAPAGDLVGYHFEPHGLEFRRPVTVAQDLSLAQLLSLDGLFAAYFEGELETQVTALEAIELWLLRSLGIFRIDHFSGYVIATN